MFSPYGTKLDPMDKMCKRPFENVCFIVVKATHCGSIFCSDLGSAGPILSTLMGKAGLSFGQIDYKFLSLHWIPQPICPMWRNVVPRYKFYFNPLTHFNHFFIEKYSLGLGKRRGTENSEVQGGQT